MPVFVSQHTRPLEGEATFSTRWSREHCLVLVLAGVTVLALYLCFRLLEPFLPALAWALALAVVFHPLHRRIEARVSNPDVAAGITLASIVLLLAIPVGYTLRNVVQNASGGLQSIQVDSAEERWREGLARFPRLAEFVHWLETRTEVRREVEKAIAATTASLTSWLSGSIRALGMLLITLFTLYFFLRDRRSGLRALRALVPLSDSEIAEVFDRVAATIQATVFGSLMVAVIQGVLGGVIFVLLGLPAPALWGAVMGLLALVPWAGTFLIWLPTAVFLALQGHWGQAMLLLGWGLLVIGLIDNLLYPFLVGSKLRMHTLLVFFSLVGGLAFFGAAGVILGPLVLAITEALIDVWRRRTRDGGDAETAIQSAT